MSMIKRMIQCMFVNILATSENHAIVFGVGNQSRFPCMRPSTKRRRHAIRVDFMFFRRFPLSSPHPHQVMSSEVRNIIKHFDNEEHGYLLVAACEHDGISLDYT